MKKKVIIFDMDGVLFDTIPFAKNDYIKRHPGMTEDMYLDIHTTNFYEGSQKYAHLQKQETEEEKKLRLALYAQEKSKMPLFKGIEELLNHLYSNKYFLVLNTNAANYLILLEKRNITHLFDFIAGSDLSKDKVEKFKIIEKRYKVNKNNILFITDALGDIKDADIAQVPTVAVTWGVHNRDYFNRGEYKNLIKIVDSVSELENFINEYYSI